MILDFNKYKKYILKFNSQDDETVIQHIDNSTSLDFLKNNIPLFDCPDKDIEKIYYFRWWTFRKHIKQTPDGFIITEFHPDVPWAGKHNSIVCPAGHHFYEGRWLKDNKYLNQYADFWFNGGGALRSYSTWLADAIWQYCKVLGEYDLAIDLLPQFVANYEKWEESNQHNSGLFWSNDDRDGGEFSISGSGLRPTLNSYMYGDAVAISQIAHIANEHEIEKRFRDKANQLKELICDNLWDREDKFFKVYPLPSKDDAVERIDFDDVDKNNNVRELHGYIPWHFDIPDESYDAAWEQIMDDKGFYAPYGPTTAEQRHPRFMYEKKTHQCLWNGPSWPFTTCFALSAMANVLTHHNQSYVTKKDYLEFLKIYARSHKLVKESGEEVCWIDENLHPHTGEWIARKILESWGWPLHKGGKERGKDYNHSTYCDLVISGLVGLKPRWGNAIEVEPLVPDDSWEYFCLDGVRYHGKDITVVYDKTGEHYGVGKGLMLYVGGAMVARSEKLEKISYKH